MNPAIQLPMRVEFYRSLYRSMYRIRRVEEEVARVYPSDDIKSPVHLSIGQEAISVGVCGALQPDDVVFGTYRGHALYLAKGGDLNRMIAELYGKASGVTGGKGGSMHLIDTVAGLMGTSAVVGTTISQAVGYAYALKLQGKSSLVASFFGDGATEEGSFHESLNFAALKKLPIIFICENNSYSIHTHQRDRQPLDNIYERAQSYGIASHRIDDSDIDKIFAWSEDATKSIRSNGAGPQLLECRTYRWKEHVGPNEDFQAGYRRRDEAQPWIDNDQLVQLRARLDGETCQAIEETVDREVREAFQFAEESSFPDDAQLYTHVFREA